MITRQLTPNCSDAEHHEWVMEQKRYAGGFHTRLIDAWIHADGENKRRLEEAFPYNYRIPLGKPLTKTKYARKCDVTNEGMNKGWVAGDGERYFKHEHDAKEWLNGWYASDIDNEDERLTEAVNEDIIYYTEWEDEDDYQYEEVNGKLIEIL